ncbi:hypothetical protein RDWZM_001223 [Blomia tropicalis]|uniref:FAS1 domain-containing protein n=1 Tax=Blomia tropicalis TaxID=40697 RepID=A0A9Q0MA98_BLOTA|nr:hypothetical protein RDWZM_001223 [Blomia tropicalis]
MKPLIWSLEILYGAIVLCLVRLPNTSEVNLDDTPRAYSQGWTPVPTNRNIGTVSASSNLAYTAINPVPAGQKLYGSAVAAAKYAVPLVATLGAASASNPNSTYVFSESISRSSYQKPQNTYMIQPAKYRQAFPTITSRSSTNSHNNNNNNSNNRTNKVSSKKVKNSKIINAEIMPIPMIKPHRHGATLGFNLPDQGLTLYLDINELATKPMAQNIGLKVVAHGKNGEDDDDSNVDNHINDSKPKSLRKRMPKLNKKPKNSTLNNTTSVKAVKNLKFQANNTVTATKQASTGTKKIKLGTKSKTNYGEKGNIGNKSNLLSPAQANKAKRANEQINQHNELNLNKKKLFDDAIRKMNENNGTRNDIPPTASRIPATFVNHVDELEEDVEQHKMGQRKEIDNFDDDSNETEDTKSSVGEALGHAVRVSGIEREKQQSDESSSELEEEEDEESENETETNGESLSSISIDDEEENEENEDETTATTTMDPLLNDIETKTTTMLPVASNTQTNLLDNPQKIATTTTSSLSENELIPPVSKSVVNESVVLRQEAMDQQFVEQMHNLIDKSAKLLDLSSQTCTAAVERCKRSTGCEPNMRSITSETGTTVRELAQQLDANLILNEGNGAFEADLQDSFDFSTNGYTVILPANSAVQRLPPNLLRRWKENDDGLSIDFYLIDGVHTLDSLVARKTINTRGKARLHINNPHNRTYTINGQRVIYANQKAPSGGIIHVIDGLLYPHSERDIMDTLKACGRLDGFVTLAEGTGFAQTLKKDGPFTVFVPSNDALQKVPDNDLELIRRNMTALREFLKYHVAHGIHYSQDLVDGQFLPSMLDGEYLQAGVRVDGCSRRLVEVNVSPLYRADIPASNGVIHVVDWILKPDDRDWCNGVILPRRR